MLLSRNINQQRFRLLPIFLASTNIPSPKSTPPSFPLQKLAGVKDMRNSTKQDTGAKGKPSYLGCTWQSNRRQRILRVGKYILSLLGIPQKKNQDHNYNIHTENLVQTRPLVSASVSLSPYEHCLVDLVGSVFVVSSILLCV